MSKVWSLGIVGTASFLLATLVAWSVFESMTHLEDEYVNYFQSART